LSFVRIELFQFFRARSNHIAPPKSGDDQEQDEAEEFQALHAWPVSFQNGNQEM
jgi:hypothetical protein